MHVQDVDIVDVDEEIKQDSHISEQCGGSTRGKLCVIGGDTQDGSLVCVQGVACHCGLQQ